MKTIKKTISVLLAVLLVFGAFAVSSSASDDSVSVNMLCYNVSGLPNINYILGKDGATDVESNQSQLGAQLNQSSYDVIATQEDFNYHSALASQLTAYPYQTIHSGGVPGGDGMNVYTKTSTIYNETRISWNKSYGIINDGADELTPKGILYTVLDLGNGIYVDFYNIHADAYDDEGSLAARKSNFEQLANLINSRSSDRPVIVTGDFNTSSHINDASSFNEILIEGCGLKDAWTELYNNGNYTDFSEQYAKYGSGYWGIWDSVEKYLYKDGGGVHIDVSSFEYVKFTNSDGESISDHNAAAANIVFTKTADFVENTQTLSVTKENSFNAFIKKVIVIFKDLYKIFSNFNDLVEYLK